MKIDKAGIYENDGETPELADGLVVRSALLSSGFYVWRIANGMYYNEETRVAFDRLSFLQAGLGEGADIKKFEVAHGS